MEYVLHNVTVAPNAAATDGWTPVEKVGDVYLKDSSFETEDGESIVVMTGRIEVAKDGAHLVVDHGKLAGGTDIDGRRFALPLDAKVSKGKLLPAELPPLAFPEGQSEIGLFKRFSAGRRL
jgi:hypothetical protein